ncbi:hypothetical protein AUP44_08505 [Tistrella mobilis]|uniref:Uncharacterized protein n=1 Tax=Tistrella mobilis TaxID=171437 RepID=A0A162KLD4_9PROT|nr:hypothetical protein AUP44_08505 [Tistrella mobilis]
MRPPTHQGLAPGQATQLTMRLDQEAIYCPWTTQPLMQRSKFGPRLSLLVDLPDRKTEATPGTVKPQDLTNPALRIHRYAGRADEFGKRLHVQHVVATQDLRSTQSTPLARRGECRVEIRFPQRGCVLGRSNNRLAFRANIDAETHRSTDTAALPDRVAIGAQ